jgi:hypothetical protein
VAQLSLMTSRKSVFVFASLIVSDRFTCRLAKASWVLSGILEIDDHVIERFTEVTLLNRHADNR